MQHPYVVFRLMQPPIDLVRSYQSTIMYQDPNVPPQPERLEQTQCSDCGSEEKLHEFTNPDLTKEKVCELCFRKRNGE